jgi:aryl-alcohol dehydrogenase-like predicted oxidoreductase
MWLQSFWESLTSMVHLSIRSTVLFFSQNEQRFTHLLLLCRIAPQEPGALAPEKLRAIFQESRKALGSHKIRVLYLHHPDRSDKHVPFEDTLREINELHKSGQM